MKSRACSSARLFTPVAVTLLLAGSGVSLALRRAADRQRDPAAGGGSPSSTGNIVAASARSRGGEGRDAAFSSRPANRAEMHERLARLQRCASDLEMTRGLMETLDELRPEDFPDFCAEADDFGSWSNGLRSVVISAWAEIDPAAALAHEFAANRGETETTTVLRIWTERNPMAALDWLAAHDRAGSPVEKVLQKLAQDDPAAAFSWALAHDGESPADMIPHNRLAATLRGMLAGHVDEAIRSFATLPEDLRHRLISQVTTGAAMDMNQAQRQQWLESLPEGRDRNVAAAALIHGMNRMVTLKERLELLNQYPEAIAQTGMAAFFRQWVGEQPADAQAALDRVPAGYLHDAAVRETIGGLVEAGDAKTSLALMNQNPGVLDEMTLEDWFTMAATNAREWQLAISQLPRVPDTAFREQAYLDIMNAWLSTDRDSARAWLAGHDDVPEKVRKALEGR